MHCDSVIANSVAINDGKVRIRFIIILVVAFFSWLVVFSTSGTTISENIRKVIWSNTIALYRLCSPK